MYKRIKLLILIFILLITIYIPSQNLQIYAKENQSDTTLEIYSSSSVYCKPDYAEIILSIENVSNSEAQAKELAYQEYEKLINSLNKIIDQYKTKINNAYTYQLYEFSDTIFKSNLNISLEINSIDKIKEIINIVNSTSTKVNNIIYKVYDESTPYCIAFQQAIQNAEIKTKQILPNNELKIISIIENSFCYPIELYKSIDDIYCNYNENNDIEITANIIVKFIVQ